MKLSEAQQHVLQRMADGDEIWTVSGRDPHCFWRGVLMDRSPGFPTVHALQSRGLIKNYAGQWQSQKYRITDAGRALLEPKP